MICPFCRHDDSRVIDSRPVEDGTQIRRRRECPQCSQRFSTQEVALLNIIKRSGATSTIFGTVVFAASATTGTVTISSSTTFAAGDFVLLNLPTVNAALADVGVTLTAIV